VRLASTRDGFQLWSETFERPLADLLALQSELAVAVATRLALHFTEGHARAAGGTESIEAYDWYLRGRRKYQTERPGFQYAGAAELERAVAIDPRFAAAHGLHAYLHALRAAVDEPYPSVAPKVRRSFQAALAVNPLQPEALMAKAIDVRWRTWDWLEVRALFEQALRVAPNDPHVLTHYAVRYFRDLGALEIAEAMLRRAVEIDPLNATPRASLSYVLRFSGRYAEASRQAERAVSLNAEHGWALQGCVLALAFDGRFADAHAALARAERASGPDHLMTLESRARLHALEGDEVRARSLLGHIAALAGRPGGAIYCDAAGWTCLELGDLAEGIGWLERAIEAGVSASVGARVCALPIERRRPGLLGSPRFQAFLRRMRLDDESLAELAGTGGLAPPSEGLGRFGLSARA
jgi:tetratricopeptide (TPR) repeat protein